MVIYDKERAAIKSDGSYLKSLLIMLQSHFISISCLLSPQLYNQTINLLLTRSSRQLK